MRVSVLPFSKAVQLQLVALVALLAGLGLAGCTPKIGDSCVLSTDCSTSGDRLCDTSQPDGYCTEFNCPGNLCPDQGACVQFDSAIPGCGFTDRSGPGGARTARSFCVAACKSDSDCRGGYVCADPRQPPWNALILDDDQTAKTCLVRPIGWGTDAGLSTPTTDAPVCSPVAPDVPPIEAGTSAPRDAGVGDAGVDAADASDASDASDGG
jgi:hypothetical protein